MIALVTLTVAAGSGFKSSERETASGRTSPDEQGIAAASGSGQGVLDRNVRSGRPETCLSARKGLTFYRLRHSHWVNLRGVEHRPKINQPTGCAYTLWLAHVWKKRSYQARLAYERWHKEQLRFQLRDFRYCENCRAWHKAIKEVQRVFPGTSSWLYSCSAAEGGWGRWVGYAGVGYSAWLRDSDTVGGNLQFRWSTFKGMYRHALEHLRERGYRVPAHLRDPGNDITWRSALGQALAGAWARYTGNDNSHWSASWGNGC